MRTNRASPREIFYAVVRRRQGLDREPKESDVVLSGVLVDVPRMWPLTACSSKTLWQMSTDLLPGCVRNGGTEEEDDDGSAY